MPRAGRASKAALEGRASFTEKVVPKGSEEILRVNWRWHTEDHLDSAKDPDKARESRPLGVTLTAANRMSNRSSRLAMVQ